MTSAQADSRSPTIVRPRARRDFAPWADPSARPLVQFDNISKRFGGIAAIDRLSLDIYQGEFFASRGMRTVGFTFRHRPAFVTESTSHWASLRPVTKAGVTYRIVQVWWYFSDSVICRNCSADSPTNSVRITSLPISLAL